MKKKCPECRLVNYPTAAACARCGGELASVSGEKGSFSGRLIRRAVICLVVSAAAVVGFYVSLIVSSKPLSYEQKKTVQAAIAILDERGFKDEVFLLKRVAVYRSSDNWLNSSVAKESAYAAANFPFEIVTIYPDFFSYPADDTERAAILLHESRHLMGEGEKEAYSHVWKSRKQLGWTAENYSNSTVWAELRRQTRDYAPELFVCDVNPFGDCTE